MEWKSMKQYVVDELRPTDCQKIKAYLEKNFDSSAIEGIYWIPVEKTLHSDKQAQHVACQPHYFAVQLEPDHMAFELLVRSRQRIRCDCIAYATQEQRNWLIEVSDAIFERLGIPI